MSIIIVKLQFSCVAFVIEFMLDHKECQEALGLTYYNRQIVDRAGIFEFKEHPVIVLLLHCPF